MLNIGLVIASTKLILFMMTYHINQWKILIKSGICRIRSHKLAIVESLKCFISVLVTYVFNK